MTSYNAANERMKRRYFAYLAEAQGYSEQTIDAVAKAIARFEEYTKWRDFKKFHIEQAKGFKHSLAGQRGCRSGEPLSKATLYATVTALKRFFVWLAGQPGYKSRIPTRMPNTSAFRPRTRGSPRRTVRQLPTDEIQGAGETIAFPKILSLGKLRCGHQASGRGHLGLVLEKRETDRAQ